MGLPADTKKVDAVYERKSDNSIIFFIGESTMLWSCVGFDESSFGNGKFESEQEV